MKVLTGKSNGNRGIFWAHGTSDPTPSKLRAAEMRRLHFSPIITADLMVNLTIIMSVGDG
jgi:hypothetical protein